MLRLHHIECFPTPVGLNHTIPLTSIMTLAFSCVFNALLHASTIFVSCAVLILLNWSSIYGANRAHKKPE